MAYGQLALEYSNILLPLQVLKSAAGYYIGTFYRESEEYYPTKEAAQLALTYSTFTQRNLP